MLTQAQAAQYCGMGVKAFKTTCPVAATTLRDGLNRFDRCKIDRWLDGLTPEAAAPVPKDWLGKLYQDKNDEGAQYGRQRRPPEGVEAVSRQA